MAGSPRSLAIVAQRIGFFGEFFFFFFFFFFLKKPLACDSLLNPLFSLSFECSLIFLFFFSGSFGSDQFGSVVGDYSWRVCGHFVRHVEQPHLPQGVGSEHDW